MSNIEPAGTPAATAAADSGDGLARPFAFAARYGAGRDRALVLGGGGIYFVAWQIAYLNGLTQRNVDLRTAEIVVGTSAGSIVAGIVSGGHLRRFGVVVDLLARLPSLLALMSPSGEMHPSQKLAYDLFMAAADSAPATIRTIGYAALAAQAPAPTNLQRSIGTVTAIRKWPSPALHITAVDAYTGERLILTAGARVPFSLAAAASSSIPGMFGTPQIQDRRCMDGGVSGSGTHSDLAAGARRALVISLRGGGSTHPAGMTVAAHGQFDELAQLEAAGTAVCHVGPRTYDLEQLMDPTAVPAALALGEEQAAADAERIREFWE
jgi:NTE family protein